MKNVSEIKQSNTPLMDGGGGIITAAVCGLIVLGVIAVYLGKTEHVDWAGKAAGEVEALKDDADAGAILALQFFDALRKLAEAEDSSTDPREGIEDLRRVADQGHAPSLYHLGTAYYRGFGVTKDIAKATELYQQAAKLGNKEAQWMLGLLLLTDTVEMSLNSDDSKLKLSGHEERTQEGAMWVLAAASQGVAAAQVHMANLFMQGVGVGRDPVEGALWLERAANQGNRHAQTRLGWAYIEGDGVAKDERKAFEWFKKAADRGYMPAQVARAFCYGEGRGTVKDEMAALTWNYLALANANNYEEAAVTSIRQFIAELEARLGMDRSLEAQKNAKELMSEMTHD